MGLFLSPFLLQKALQALLVSVKLCWVHIDDILIWGSDVADVSEREEKVLRLLRAARFRINTRKSQLAPRNTIQYCGLEFTADKIWNFTADKIATLKEVLRTWGYSKTRTTRYLGFLAYVLNASGLSPAWARLVQHYRSWRYLFDCLFSRLPRSWKDKRPRRINWSCDAAKDDLAVVDERGILRWHARHEQHINVAEAMALTKAMLLAPCGAAIWTDSKVAEAWTKRAKKGWHFSAMLSLLRVAKRLQINWLPSPWNPADAFTRLSPPFKRTGLCDRKQMGHFFTPRECINNALKCGELSPR